MNIVPRGSHWYTIAALITLSVPGTALADTVYWVDWQSGVSGTSVTGVINAPGGPITVTYTGNYYFAQFGTGTDYYSPDAYTGGVVGNAPPAAEMIALGTGSGGTFTFSSPIHNPFVAVVSLNGPTVTFNASPTLVASGPGYWGSGTFNIVGGQVGGSGEPHGTLSFAGNYSSLSLTEQGSENWRGFTIGILGPARSSVPEPSAWASFAAVTGLVSLASRKLRRAA